MLVTDLVYKAIAFALLTPAVVWFVNRMIARGGEVISDADIATVLLTTPRGIVGLLLGSAVMIAITFVEVACLIAIGDAAMRGSRMDARSAVVFGASRAGAILRLALRMVLRIVAGLIPFAMAGGALYLALLHDHDINYYLARNPPEFWIALALSAVLAIVLVLFLLRTIARWSLSLPLILFEQVSPGGALSESARRAAGKHRLILSVLSAWAILGLALNGTVAMVLEVTGRASGPYFAGSMVALLGFVGVVAFFWILFGLLIAIFNISLFSALVVWFYRSVSHRSEGKIADSDRSQPLSSSHGVIVGGIAVVLLSAVGIALLVFTGSGNNQPVLVIAHRGASANAPENTLAAFRQAAIEQADVVELDVQETLDGVVVVNHDSDLMKVGGSPMRIWEHSLADLRTVDIGSHFAPEFKAERIATLAEALSTCRGKTKVLVELKSYGHNQHLEERVVSIVEKAGMTNDCMYMSLDHSMAKRMKQLRPSWRVGVLSAKVIGDLTTLRADFVAVEARMATRPFVRRAHQAQEDVFVWTVDDPAWMLTMMSQGVDGLITNRPGLAREVISRRSQMSQTQRILLALLVHMGASTDALEKEDALRP